MYSLEKAIMRQVPQALLRGTLNRLGENRKLLPIIFNGTGKISELRMKGITHVEPHSFCNALYRDDCPERWRPTVPFAFTTLSQTHLVRIILTEPQKRSSNPIQ